MCEVSGTSGSCSVVLVSVVLSMMQCVRKIPTVCKYVPDPNLVACRTHLDSLPTSTGMYNILLEITGT